MTRRLETGRFDDNQLISTGPTKLNNLETALAEIFNITQDSTMARSPFTIDNDGNIGYTSDSEMPRLKGDGSGGVGFLLWDDDESDELRIVLNNGYLYIEENTGTPGGSATWYTRMLVEMTGDAEDAPGQDILNHKNIASSMGAEGEILVVNDSGELAFASQGSDEPVVPAVHLSRSASHTVSNGASWNTLGFSTLSFFAHHDVGDMYSGNDYIDIVTSGTYLVSIATKMTDNSGDDAQIGLGWGTAATTPSRFVIRQGGVDSAYFSLTHSVIWPFTAGDKVYLMARAYGGTSDGSLYEIEISLARIGAAS